MKTKPQSAAPQDHLQSSVGICEERTEPLFVRMLLRTQITSAASAHNKKSSQQINLSPAAC